MKISKFPRRKFPWYKTSLQKCKNGQKENYKSVSILSKLLKFFEGCIFKQMF